MCPSTEGGIGLSNGKRNKVLLVGWDAADWKVIAPLMDAGQMPHLEQLVRQGVMGNLATLQPILSPMLWTSIATGKRAWRHGIHGFVEPEPGTGRVRPITNLGRKVKALWNILSQSGYRSNVVGWWPSHPAEAIDGVMVSDYFQKAAGPGDKPWPMPPGTVHPQRLAEHLRPLRVHPWEIEGDQLLHFVPQAREIDQDKDGRLFTVAKILAECASVHAAATAVIQNEPWDFMAVYYDAIDHFCHGFMKYHPPRLDWVSEEDFERYKEVVNAAYRFHDLMLGALVTLAGPDTHVMLVSDHGFHPDHLRPRELPNEPAGPAAEHRPYGTFVLAGPDIRQDELVFGATLLDVTPTVLALFGLPVGRDMDGKVLASAFAAPPQVRYVDSWEDIPGADGRHPPDMGVDAVDDHETVRQLVDLGYIDRPDEEAEVAAAKTVRELRYNLAQDLADARRYHDAIEELDALWDEWPEEGRFGVKLFNCRLALGDTAAARETLELLKVRKRDAATAARDELLELERRREEGGRAPADLTDQERRDRLRLRKRMGVNQATFAYLEGLLLHGEGRHGEALAALEGAEGVQRHNMPDLLQTRGRVLLALKRWEEAETTYRAILEMDPVNAQARLGLAESLLPRRRNKDALEEAMAAAGLLYHNPRAHYLAGVALHRMGRVEDAVKALRTAVTQNPAFPLAHRRLAHIFDQRLHEPEHAAEHLALADAARQRLEALRAGEAQPGGQRPTLDVDAVAGIGAGDAGPLPPPDGRTVVVVSGLPRSGTSMMMQMLAAGGVPVMADDSRAADEDNPRGYFELEQAKAAGGGGEWVDEAGGRAVKVVAQLLPGLPASHAYRVLFMERPLTEVVASQQAMLRRLGRRGAALSATRLSHSYLKQIAAVRHELDRRSGSFTALSVPYHRVLEDPRAEAERINRFLGGGLDVAAMAAAVDPALRRQGVAAAKAG